ncbi:hypothetical protein [Pararhizobium sp. O133]|uniref:DUF5983 family protein n=1 Tax=Pararhizobium sp. O133 TaxID=3449278 RepID=UPI003F68943F
MAELEKRTIFVLGTYHVSWETADPLNNRPFSQWSFVGGPYADYGWFVYAHDENDGTIPADLSAVMQFATSNGCTNILFDCDADQVEGLPVYK